MYLNITMSCTSFQFLFSRIFSILLAKVAAKKEMDKIKKAEKKKKDEEDAAAAAATAALLAAAALKPVIVTAEAISALSAEEREKRVKAVKKKLKAVQEVKEKKAAGNKLDAGQVSHYLYHYLFMFI